jgi:hypothetical protein
MVFGNQVKPIKSRNFAQFDKKDAINRLRKSTPLAFVVTENKNRIFWDKQINLKSPKYLSKFSILIIAI